MTKRVTTETLAKDLAKAHTGAAMRRIINTLDSPDEKLAFAAATWIVERAEGKATQQVTGQLSITHNVELLLDALRSLAAGTVAHQLVRSDDVVDVNSNEIN